MWSRTDQGYGVEGLHNEDTAKSTIQSGKPMEIQIFERCLSGQYKGYLRKGNHL
jgi:hypothetical protein